MVYPHSPPPPSLAHQDTHARARRLGTLALWLSLSLSATQHKHSSCSRPFARRERRPGSCNYHATTMCTSTISTSHTTTVRSSRHICLTAAAAPAAQQSRARSYSSTHVRSHSKARGRSRARGRGQMVDTLPPRLARTPYSPPDLPVRSSQKPYCPSSSIDRLRGRSSDAPAPIAATSRVSRISSSPCAFE